MRHSRPVITLIASSLLLAGCGSKSIIAAYAVEKMDGEWCAVAEEAKADALRAGSAYFADRAAVLHFRESVLAWAEYTIEDKRGRIRDTYSFDENHNVSRLTRTGLFDDNPKLYVRYERGDDGRLALTPKARRNIEAHRATGYGTEWLFSPIYSTFDAMPFAVTVRVRSMKRSIRRAC